MYKLLRIHRKQTELLIEDLSFLLGLPDSSKLSRCERGKRKPSLEIIFTYQILFQAPLDKLLENERINAQRKIALNIDPLIESLAKEKQTKKVEARITFLKLVKELNINNHI